MDGGSPVPKTTHRPQRPIGIFLSVRFRNIFVAGAAIPWPEIRLTPVLRFIGRADI